MTPKIVQTFLRVWPQWVASVTVSLLSVSFGLAVGWTSPYLALLTSENSPFPVTKDQAAWVASLLPFGRVIGAVVGLLLMEYFGSKRSLLMAGVPIFIGWFCMIFANSAAWLYVFRICPGISIGMYFSCFSLYIGEIAAANIRGALISIIVNGIPIGILIGNIMGTTMSMMWFGIISLILNTCYLVIFPFLPQSPYYHVQQNRMEDAKKTIEWFHRNSNVGVELAIVERFIQSSRTKNLRERLTQIAEKKNRRAFGIVTVLFVFMQLSGLNTVTFYMEIIMKKAGVTSIEPSIVVILSSTLGILTGWISVSLIDRCGRRILVAISCSCVIIAMALLGLHFMLLEQDFNPKNLESLPILSMMLFAMISIGLVPVPATMLGELFPPDLKSIAGFIASITSALFAFICSRTYQLLIDLISEKYVYFMYALTMTFCLIYSILYMPETKGKTLQEIQDMLTRQSIQVETLPVPHRSKNNGNQQETRI